MADLKRSVINGVNTINLHGKWYVEVAERVRLVHDQKREFEVLESAPLAVGDRCLWRVVIRVDGRQYVGNAEAKLNARPGSPDATNPFECAETSALGRALAFAGFGSVESIASFDEVYRATTAAAIQSEPEATKHAQSAGLAHLVQAAKSRAYKLGRATNTEEWRAFVQEATGQELRDEELTVALIGKVNGALAKIENERKNSAA